MCLRLSKGNYFLISPSSRRFFPQFSSSTILLFSSTRFIGSTASEQFVGSSQNESSNNIGAAAKPPSSSSNNSNTAKKPPPTADFVTTCPFQCLGLTRTASKEQVREHFLQLAKVHHPDVGGESWKFKRVNAAYKQSIEMIETGYAAKTSKQNKGQSYQAPNERECNGEKTEGCATDEEQFRSSQNARARTSSAHSYSNYESRQQQKQSAGKNKYANAERTSNFSSANTYANAERKAGSWTRNTTGDSTSQQHTYSSKAEYYNSFMHNTNQKYSKNNNNSSSMNDEERRFHTASYRDEKAKAHNKSADWFKEMYETSNARWRPGSSIPNKQNNNDQTHHHQNTNNNTTAGNHQHYYYNSFDGKKSSSSSSSSSAADQKNQNESKNNNHEHHDNPETDEHHHHHHGNNRYEQYRKTSFGSDESAEREFGSDEGWFEFRENFFRQNRSITTRDLYRFRFSQAATVEEIDAIYNQSMEENIFSGYDIGEPLFLALERYHLELGIGLRHMEKCFDTIDKWETKTRRTAPALYYHVILKLVTNEKMMELFPETLDSNVCTEVVWKVLQRMQDKNVVDDECVGRSWWELLRLACMHRDPHHW